jgi:transporter family protein
MSWLYFSILTALLWGLGQIFIKKGFSRISILWSVVISAAINALIYVPFSLFYGGSFVIPIPYLLLTFVITFLYIFFFYAIEKGQLAFAGTIFATYPLTTVVLSFIFLHERPSVLQYIMMALILSGSILLSYFGTKSSKKSIKSSWLFWAVLGSVTTGTADFLAKIVIDNVPLQTYNLYYPICYIGSLAIFWFFDKKNRTFPKKMPRIPLLYSIVGISMLTLGLLSFNFALELGQASIVSTVSSGYVAILVLLAYFFLKEPINKKQWIAISLIAIGIIFINVK